MDISNLSSKELFELAAKRKQEEASDPKRIEKIKALKARFEKEAEKEGFTLAQIFTFSEKRQEPVKGPDGQLWYRRGKKPQWLKEMEAKGEFVELSFKEKRDQKIKETMSRREQQSSE